MSAHHYDEHRHQHVPPFASATAGQRSSSFGSPLAFPFSFDAVPQSPPARHGHSVAAVMLDDWSFTDSLPADEAVCVSATDADRPFILPSLADDDSSSARTAAAPTSNSPSFLSLSPHSYSSAESDGTNSTLRSSSPASHPVSTGSADSSGATEPPVRKRRRALLTASERLSRRRAQHRAVDASRRQREAASIARLLQLIRQQQQQQVGAGVAGEADADETGETDEDDIEGKQNKAGRLTVLESSIALIEQLTAACSTMERACNAKDAQVSRVSSQLHSVAALVAQQATHSMAIATSLDRITGGHDCSQLSSYRRPQLFSSTRPSSHSSLAASTQPDSSSSTFLSVLPPATSSYLLHSDRSCTLSRGGLATFSTLCIAVVTPPGIIVDVSDRLLAYTGWGRSDLVPTTFERFELSTTLRVTPLVANQQLTPSGSSRLRYVQQYPSSMAQLVAVKSGEKRKGHSTWRCRKFDGTVLETDSTFWGEWDVPVEKGEYRPPDRMLFVYEMQDAVVVDSC